MYHFQSVWQAKCPTGPVDLHLLPSLIATYNEMVKARIFTSHVSGRGNIFGSVRLCVCLCLFVLCSLNCWTHGPLNLAHALRTIISRTSLKVKVKGQGHQGQKCKNSSFQPSFIKRWPKGHRSRSQGQVQSCLGSLVPHRLAEGAARGRFHLFHIHEKGTYVPVNLGVLGEIMIAGR